MLPEFDLEEPRSLKDALAALGDGGGDSVPLAGGTNLLIDMRAGRAQAGRLVSLGHVDALRGIDLVNGQVSLGARTTLSEIIAADGLAVAAPGLVAAAKVFAGAMVRNAATVAGNICSASPAADLVSPLMALGAEMVLEGPGGERVVPLDRFLVGYHELDRRPDELVTRVRWPARPANSRHLFYKLAMRKGDAITVVGLSVLVAMQGGKCSLARIALGSVAPVVKRAEAAEATLQNAELSDAAIEAAADQAQAASTPIDDVRASGEYRRHAVKVLTRRLLTQARDELSS
jgi:carbon-monoxide dehydrogenase medium subunit